MTSLFYLYFSFNYFASVFSIVVMSTTLLMAHIQLTLSHVTCIKRRTKSVEECRWGGKNKVEFYE